MRFLHKVNTGRTDFQFYMLLTATPRPHYVSSDQCSEYLRVFPHIYAYFMLLVSSDSVSSTLSLHKSFPSQYFAYLKFRVFWDVAPCSHVEGDRCFRGAYCLASSGWSSPSWCRQYFYVQHSSEAQYWNTGSTVILRIQCTSTRESNYWWTEFCARKFTPNL
jgi:hypothetical protein